MSKSKPPQSDPAVRKAHGPRYGRGVKTGVMLRASESDDPIYTRASLDADGHVVVAPAKRNAVHSVLTALPVLMLVAGLWIFYRNEGAQTEAGPLREQSEQLSGRYAGVSVISGGGEGRHYLWLQTDPVDNTSRRGFRLSPLHVESVRQAVQQGDAVVIDAAPTVEGSDTRWVWRVTLDDDVVIDDSERLR